MRAVLRARVGVLASNLRASARVLLAKSEPGSPEHELALSAINATDDYEAARSELLPPPEEEETNE